LTKPAPVAEGALHAKDTPAGNIIFVQNRTATAHPAQKRGIGQNWSMQIAFGGKGCLIFVLQF
jgi:hypothetical protein